MQKSSISLLRRKRVTWHGQTALQLLTQFPAWGRSITRPGALLGPLEHRVQNSDLDLKWSRGRVTVGRSCPYAGCQCAEGRQNLCLSWWGWPHTGLMPLSQCQGCGEGRALLPDASWKGVEWAMESGHYVLSHFIPYTIMVVSKGSFLQDPAWPRR